MDADIKEEFTSVHAEFASVREQFASVREEFTSVRAEFVSVHAQFAAVREEFAAVRGEMRGSETTLRQEIREEGVSTRRHFDIIAESLRDDIRIIAEGLIALDTKVERMRQST